MTSSDPSSKLRVLLVPDYIAWVTGTIARRIAQHNRWIEPTICSWNLLRELSWRDAIPKEIDLIHFQIADHAFDLIHHFEGKVPCVASIHHVEEEVNLGPEPGFDAVTTASSQWRDYLTASGVDPAKLVVVPYGVDAEEFRPPSPAERRQIRSRLGLPDDAFVIGFAAKRSSNTSGRKGIDILEKAIAEVSRRLPNPAFAIIGPGWGELVERQRAAGIRCAYVPFVRDHTEVAEFQRSLDAYWITSRIEGGPVPLLEAMASGVCCISTPVGMARDLVRDGENGLIAPFDDVEAFVRQTRKLVEDPELRRIMGIAARETILEGYQWWQTCAKVHELYRVAIERFRARPGSPAAPTMPDPDPEPRLAVPGEVPLTALAARDRPWARAREHMHLSVLLGEVGESRQANRAALRAVAACPFDRAILREAMRRWPLGAALVSTLSAALMPVRRARRAWSASRGRRSAPLPSDTRQAGR